jgi:transcriptional regulator with XRE-family HTH domain
MEERSSGSKVVANGARVVQLREANGWSAEELARKAAIAVDTVERIEAGKKPVYRTSLAKVARALGVEIDEISNAPRATRNAQGMWRVSGGDIEVAGYFDLPDGPKTLTAEVEIRQRGFQLEASGPDHHGDIVRFEGYLTEDGGFVRGNYRFVSDRLNGYGVLMLKYLGDGKTMKGFYLGRETGQDSSSGFIMGWLRLDRMSEDSAGAMGPVK